jgi:ribose transport system substrate-binding protein
MGSTTKRRILRSAIAASYLLVAGQMAVAQDSSPTADQREGETLVRSLDPRKLPSDWTIPESVGYVANYFVADQPQSLTEGQEARASDYGINFSIEDANLDLDRSLSLVDQFLEDEVSVLNITPVDEDASGQKLSGIAYPEMPIICQSFAVTGCTTVITVDNYGTGFKTGVWAGNYANQHFGGSATIMIIGLPALSATAARAEGFMDGITSILGDNAVLTESLDGQGMKDVSAEVAAEAFLEHPEVNVVFGINDESALGGLQSFVASGLDTDNALIIGIGCESTACKEELLAGGPFKASTAVFPEYQGRLMIDAGVASFNGIPLPEQIVAPSIPLTIDNIHNYYTEEDDTYELDFDAVAEIPLEVAT